MKSGSGDDPFAEDAQESSDTATPSTSSDQFQSPPEEQSTDTSTQEMTGETGEPTTLPYIFRRDNVKEGRSQQPMFLQDDTADLISETLDTVESEFDEDVYKTDVVEALIVAGGEDTTPESVLRRWGYGMKNS